MWAKGWRAGTAPAPVYWTGRAANRLPSCTGASRPTGSVNGDRFSVRGVALLVNRCLRAAGITDRSGPHVLRHTFATHALRARPNLRAVQELLGHAWVTTTQRYTHLEVEDLQDQVADLPANR